MRVAAFALLMLAVAQTRADVTLAPLFTDHLVLQRGQPIPVWGHAAPREAITAIFRGQTTRTVTAADGRWSLELGPFAAAADPADLVVSGNTTVAVRDVLVGEVWLVSGQSNMEFPVEKVRDAAGEITAAIFPQIRELKIARAVSTTPTDTVKSGGWQPTSPAAVKSFSAAGYFFARELHQRLRVPIGIINSSYGGTQIESWLSDAARNSTSLASTLAGRWKQAMSEWPPERVARYPADMERWQKAQAEAEMAKTTNNLPWPQPPATNDSPALPGGLFNGMIAPLARFAIRGVLWYQGESNVGRAAEYAELFPVLIRSWRNSWAQPDLPFYFVQLPNFADHRPGDTDWARLREAQSAALALPATAMAVTIDVGDAENLHPPDKQDVGHRLALIALSSVYGFPGESSGPRFDRTATIGPIVRVHFQHAGSGLLARGPSVRGLELAGSDRVFHAAAVTIAGDTLVASAPAVPIPVALRYAWSNAPEANLMNDAGLPAAPFRTDTW